MIVPFIQCLEICRSSGTLWFASHRISPKARNSAHNLRHKPSKIHSEFEDMEHRNHEAKAVPERVLVKLITSDILKEEQMLRCRCAELYTAIFRVPTPSTQKTSTFPGHFKDFSQFSRTKNTNQKQIFLETILFITTLRSQHQGK